MVEETPVQKHTKRDIFRRIGVGRILFWSCFLAVLLSAWAMLTQPVCVFGGRTEGLGAEPGRLRAHVETLSVSCFPRDSAHPENLLKAAGYIRERFEAAGGRTSLQSFEIRGNSYCNVLAFFGPESPERVLVGAHYDAYGELPGADDNASGVAGLLELATLLGRHPPAGRVELVAYTLEEPPYFGSPHMGSVVHAESLQRAGVRLKGAIVLEMIGRFSDAPGSQDYPSPLMGALYPGQGDFIALIGRPQEMVLLRQVKSSMKRASSLPVESITAPTSLFFGMTLSDHASYWDAGYPALMVTDTAFLRNRDYHTSDDTAEKLDYDRMAQAVQGVHAAVLDLSSR
jgi:hypothetical protein